MVTFKPGRVFTMPIPKTRWSPYVRAALRSGFVLEIGVGGRRNVKRGCFLQLNKSGTKVLLTDKKNKTVFMALEKGKPGDRIMVVPISHG